MFGLLLLLTWNLQFGLLDAVTPICPELDPPSIRYDIEELDGT